MYMYICIYVYMYIYIYIYIYIVWYFPFQGLHFAATLRVLKPVLCFHMKEPYLQMSTEQYYA